MSPHASISLRSIRRAPLFGANAPIPASMIPYRRKQARLTPFSDKEAILESNARRKIASKRIAHPCSFSFFPNPKFPTSAWLCFMSFFAMLSRSYPCKISKNKDWTSFHHTPNRRNPKGDIYVEQTVCRQSCLVSHKRKASRSFFILWSSRGSESSDGSPDRPVAWIWFRNIQERRRCRSCDSRNAQQRNRWAACPL